MSNGERHELSDAIPVKSAEEDKDESETEGVKDPSEISGTTSRALSRSSTKSPISVYQRKMASKTSEPTADEITLMTSIMREIKIKSQREAMIEAMKKFATDPETKEEAEKLVATMEEMNKDEGNKGNWQSREPKTASRFVQNIPKFGINEKITWPELVSHLEMIQETGIYNDTELKIMLFGAFEGPASEYVRAHKEIFQQSFARAMTALEKIFGKTISQNVHDLSSIQQRQNESVDYFEGRLINAAGRLKPSKPSFKSNSIAFSFTSCSLFVSLNLIL